MIAGRTDLVAPTGEELHARYTDYRRRQARRLVGMLPQEAIRPLYRHALAADNGSPTSNGGSPTPGEGSAATAGPLGQHDDSFERNDQPLERSEDPLERLMRFCETLLPLPPFEVWLQDVRRSPRAHLGDLDASADVPTPASPATLEARRFGPDGRAWVARLRGFRDEDAWRGFIAFEESGTGHVHRTSLIFREPGPSDLRDRFLAFEPATLEAFLRSTLP